MPQRFVKDDAQWAGFRSKLAKWLCLCENYPYRISFLVLVIQDRVQKEQVNRLCLTHPSRGDKYGLVHYRKGRDKARTLLDCGVVYNGKGGGKAAVSATASASAKAEEPGGVSGEEPDVAPAQGEEPGVAPAQASEGLAPLSLCLELDDDMPIVEAYFRHVEQYIYSHPKARKMLSLDGDPVRATFTPVIGGSGFCIIPADMVRRSFSLRCSCNRWLTWARQRLRSQRPATSPWATFSAP